MGETESSGDEAGKPHSSETSHLTTIGKQQKGASGKFFGSTAKVPSPQAISTTPGTSFRMFHSEGRISSSSLNLATQQFSSRNSGNTHPRGPRTSCPKLAQGLRAQSQLQIGPFANEKELGSQRTAHASLIRNACNDTRSVPTRRARLLNDFYGERPWFSSWETRQSSMPAERRLGCQPQGCSGAWGKIQAMKPDQPGSNPSSTSLTHRGLSEAREPGLHIPHTLPRSALMRIKNNE